MRQRGLLWTALVGLAALSVATGSGHARPRAFALTGYHIRAHGGLEGSKLISVAPLTGRRLPGRGLRLGDAVGAGALSPDRRLVAFGGSNFGEVVLVDLVRMRRLAPIRLARACCHGDFFHSVDVLAWPAPHRLIATTGQTPGKRPTPRTLRILDPVTRRPGASVRLGIPLATAVGSSGRVVVLAAPRRGIGAARLAVVDRAGAIRLRRLRRIRTGTSYDSWPQSHREAALAVDFAAGRAFVLGAGEPVAEVDLRRLRVRYHPLAPPALDRGTASAGPPQPTGTRNPERGAHRTARWIGHGRIAVSGYDSEVIGHDQANTPLGLRIIDTRRWTARVVDPRVSSFEFVRGTLLASTVAWDPRLGRFAGFGLAGFGPAGRLRYQLLPYRAIGPPLARDWLVHGRRLYLLQQRQRDELRDPRTGALLLRFHTPWYVSTMFSWRPPNRAVSRKTDAGDDRLADGPLRSRRRQHCPRRGPADPHASATRPGAASSVSGSRAGPQARAGAYAPARDHIEPLDGDVAPSFRAPERALAPVPRTAVR
jgi:hypothetical protein